MPGRRRVVAREASAGNAAADILPSGGDAGAWDTCEQLQAARDAVDFGTFAIDAQTGAGHASERAARMVGLSPGRVNTRHERLALVHPDNRGRFTEARRAEWSGDGPFTTKEVGRGSGLGLPQVFGFAKQSGGGVRASTARPGAAPP